MAYHHGDARAALLRAAAELLEQEGAAGLSIRQVAERAGLSRQALYNHFANKEGLLAELAMGGFHVLAAQIDANGASAAALDRLSAAAASYIAFGSDRPALFRLMFGRELVDLRRYAPGAEAARVALARLSALVAELGSAADPNDAALVAWSLVHGYTALCIEAGIEEPDRRGERARLFAHAVAALVRADPAST